MIRRFSTRMLTFFMKRTADPADNDDIRLQKSLLVIGAIMFIPFGILWGLVYFAFDRPMAGMIPIGYSIISLASVITFLLTRRYYFFPFQPAAAHPAAAVSAYAVPGWIHQRERGDPVVAGFPIECPAVR